MNNPFIDLDELELPEFCSLYRAIRYIAFGEKILPESYALDCFGFENFIEDKRKNNERADLFLHAASALMLALKQDKFRAVAGEVDYGPENMYPDEFVEIDPFEWLRHGNLVDWHQSSLGVCSDPDNTKARLYYDIEIKTALVLEHFSAPPLKPNRENLESSPQITLTSIKSGRPYKFDWDKITPEIVFYFYDGADLKSSISKHADNIYLICAEKYGENAAPSVASLVKKLRPIVHRLTQEE